MTKRELRRFFFVLGVTAAMHAAVLFLPFRIVVLGSYESPLNAYIVTSVPVLWSFIVYLFFRSPPERAIAYLSLAMSIFWFMSVGNIRT
jgi:hypothetical protein